MAGFLNGTCGLASGNSVPLVGLALACRALPAAVAAAEWFAALWLVVDLAVVLRLAEGCWVPLGCSPVAAKVVVLADTPADGGDGGRCMCVRNGIIA